MFHPPHEPDKNYVKRVVGVASDTLEMRDKRLYLNGAPVHEPYARYLDGRGDAVHPDMEWQSHHLIASELREYHPTRDNWGPIVVPEERYFVLGDNRDNSEDSRYWGFVSRDEIRGRPWFVYYSFERTTDEVLPWLRPYAGRESGRSSAEVAGLAGRLCRREAGAIARFPHP